MYIKMLKRLIFKIKMVISGGGHMGIFLLFIFHFLQVFFASLKILLK